jgi:hypothetical protein
LAEVYCKQSKRRGSRIKGKDLIVNPKRFIGFRDTINRDQFPFLHGCQCRTFLESSPRIRINLLLLSAAAACQSHFVQMSLAMTPRVITEPAFKISP